MTPEDIAFENRKRQVMDKMFNKPDIINNPPHYHGKRFECIDIIEDYSLGFHLGNAVKYILRCDKKGNKVQDIRKAIWYLERECLREAENSIGDSHV